MKNLNVGELKTHFSQVLEDIKEGKKIIISFGKRKEKLAVIVPYETYAHRRRNLGLLAARGSFRMKKDFKLSEEEFLGP